MFFKGSRYANVGDREMLDNQGHVIRYKATRLIPATPAMMGHLVSQGERLDQIAHRYYQDAERFWRICDANLALWPDDLVVEVGGVLLIPRVEG